MDRNLNKLQTSDHPRFSRRRMMHFGAFGLLTISTAPIYSSIHVDKVSPVLENNVHRCYPSISDDEVAEVVGKSHFDFDRVKEMVDLRPELARSTTDWGFGDFESAIEAASHVGRRDIALYLIKKGARPNIFTHAMLGHYELVRNCIEATSEIQQTMGPHGISLMQHAYAGERMKDTLNAKKREEQLKLIEYLEKLGDADGDSYMSMSDDEKEKYLGDYKYSSKPSEGFSIQLNMRKLLSLGKIGKFGGALYKTGENIFMYNGAPSTTILFHEENNKIVSLTVTEPGFELTAQKIN